MKTTIPYATNREIDHVVKDALEKYHKILIQHFEGIADKCEQEAKNAELKAYRNSNLQGIGEVGVYLGKASAYREAAKLLKLTQEKLLS